MITYEVEYTDTFGGEANYCWVKRATIESPFSDDVSHALAIKRLKHAAKKAMGISGIKGEWCDSGDFFEFRPRSLLTVLFIQARY